MIESYDNAAGVAVLQEVLTASEPRPTYDAKPQSVKTQYAVRFADVMATVLARDLSPKMDGIRATRKREAASVGKKTQLDVNFSTPDLGLALGISLKSVHLREAEGAARYTHNMKRNKEELRIEASGYHKRQPYAVLVAVLFIPFDACSDARTASTPSSFGSWVQALRPFAGRSGPHDDVEQCEAIYIALYVPDGTDLRFFDVMADPPKNGFPSRDGPLLGPNGRPRRLLTYSEFLDAAYHAYLRRNSAEFTWAGGEAEPISLDGTDPEDSSDHRE